METFIAFIHIFVCVLLVIFVLLQDSKGGAMGALGGGGGSNTLFGSTGAGNFLTKTTTWLAVVFAVTCISLTYLSSNRNDSVLDKVGAGAAAAGAGSAPVEKIEMNAPETKTEKADDTKSGDKK